MTDGVSPLYSKKLAQMLLCHDWTCFAFVIWCTVDFSEFDCYQKSWLAPMHFYRPKLSLFRSSNCYLPDNSNFSQHACARLPWCHFFPQGKLVRELPVQCNRIWKQNHICSVCMLYHITQLYCSNVELKKPAATLQHILDPSPFFLLKNQVHIRFQHCLGALISLSC